MFYSQFILAKKGPLGTIWIAAHLERKLRKNQVADTDIGFSVDSILFPDVPIALRLSSHLLLGVVRIYSRKVNYLFDDCSEALLKIKQAFRSTAVDLPPEESTAPYHSITLPETFDLDDFELPDNDMFQGNYVDHHISTREQITLQDTMEGIVFSTSQFGLDERFGDGDTSQIGLDIDEDLFLRKVASQGNDGGPKEIDETFEGIPGTSVLMEDYVNDNQNAIPAAISEAPEQLVGCMSPLDPHKTLASDDLMRSEGNELKPEAVEYAETDHRKSSDHAPVPNSEDNGYLLGDVEMNQVESSTYLESSMEVTREGASENVSLSVSAEHAKSFISVPECSNGHLSAMNGPDMHRPESVECAETDVRTDNGAGASHIDRADAESPSCSQVTTELEDPGRRTCSVDNEFQNNMGESCSPSNKIASSICPSESPDRPEVVNVEARMFQELKETDSAHERVEFPGLRACNSLKQIDIPSFPEEESTDAAELGLDKRHVPEDVGGKRLDSGIDNFPSRENQPENVEGYEAAEIPPPEKLLAVSEGLFSKQSELVMESTPEKEFCGDDDNGAGDNLISGKKRSFTESTFTVQSLNSGESFSMNKSRRTAESIPGDDDLLSSILVGRKTSILKLKPTPSATEIASTKRLRSAPRSSSSKRKVVMDDMMVLHGDTIRLQLTNTEDIRRIRKKAPCTRPEIAMIQRMFEEEIFSEPIFTGVPAALVSLQRETFDFRKIKMAENDQEDAPVELAKDKESSNAVRNDMEMQDDHTCIQTENQHAEISGVRSEQEILNYDVEVNIDRQNIEVTDVADHNVLGPDLSLQYDPIFNDLAENITVDTELAELAKIHGTEAIENVDRDNGGAFETASLRTVGCDITISVNAHESVDGFENNNLIVANPEASGMGCDEKDLASISPRDEEIKEGAGFSLEPAINVENAMMDEGENADFKEADLSHTMNTEVIAEISAPEFLGDFEDGTIGIDTEFLNVDDDEVAEDDEDYMPGTEDIRLPENTGWSSRTRAVSKYLQILFEKESLHGRRVLAMDNLLTGKTRKEASRMFFETLVLKTKDYIHVEQPNAFDNINVKPKTKLMKADF